MKTKTFTVFSLRAFDIVSFHTYGWMENLKKCSQQAKRTIYRNYAETTPANRRISKDPGGKDMPEGFQSRSTMRLVSTAFVVSSQPIVLRFNFGSAMKFMCVLGDCSKSISHSFISYDRNGMRACNRFSITPWKSFPISKQYFSLFFNFQLQRKKFL